MIKYIFLYKMKTFFILHNENIISSWWEKFSTRWKILFYTMIIFFPVIWNFQLWKIWNCYRTLSNWKIVFYEIFSGECNFGKNYQCTGCVKLKLIKHVMLTLTSHEEFTFFFFWEINVYFIVWNSYMFNFFGRSFFLEIFTYFTDWNTWIHLFLRNNIRFHVTLIKSEKIHFLILWKMCRFQGNIFERCLCFI